eukprot:351328-Chlamydomonas_euryale.AAC.11
MLPDLPGVAILSGGQSEDEAMRRLRAMAELSAKQRSWRQGQWPVITFSYGRALQVVVLVVGGEGVGSPQPSISEFTPTRHGWVHAGRALVGSSRQAWVGACWPGVRGLTPNRHEWGRVS